MRQYINGTLLKYCNLVKEISAGLLNRKYLIIFVLMFLILLLLCINIDFLDYFFNFSVIKTVLLAVCVVIFFIV